MDIGVPSRGEIGRVWRRPDLANVEAALSVATMVCTALVLFGSFEMRTGRSWPTLNSGMSESEGPRALLFGLVALAAQIVSAYADEAIHRLRRAVAPLVVTVSLAIAAGWAWQVWQELLRERVHPLAAYGPEDYTLSIAGGLPIVAVCGAAGTAFALGLTLVRVRHLGGG